jgi:hypothetical protein
MVVDRCVENVPIGSKFPVRASGGRGGAYALNAFRHSLAESDRDRFRNRPEQLL